MTAKCSMPKSNMNLHSGLLLIAFWLPALVQIASSGQLASSDGENEIQRHNVEAVPSANSWDNEVAENGGLMKKLQNLPTDKLKNLLKFINKESNQQVGPLDPEKGNKDGDSESQSVPQNGDVTLEVNGPTEMTSPRLMAKAREENNSSNDVAGTNALEGHVQNGEAEMKYPQSNSETGNSKQQHKLEPATRVLIKSFENDSDAQESVQDVGDDSQKSDETLRHQSKDNAEDVFAGTEENAASTHGTSSQGESRMKLTHLLPKSESEKADQSRTEGEADSIEGSKIHKSLPTSDGIELSTGKKFLNMAPNPRHQSNKPQRRKATNEQLPMEIIQQINDAMIEKVRESGDRRASLTNDNEAVDVSSTTEQGNQSEFEKRGGNAKAMFAFSYNPESPIGPEMWKVLHTDWTCQGRKQSPISIRTDDVVNDTLCKNIAIRVEPEGRPLRGILRNNGHAPTLSLTTNSVVRLFGGLLPNDYYLKQLHFHFGCENNRGSEHKIDGQSFPMELHLVFWDKKTFETFSEAAKSDRGIAVVAVLFQRAYVPASQVRSTPVTQFLQVLKKISNEGDFVQISEIFDFRLERLIPNVMNPTQADRFFTYEGSLTTPGCYESVTWIVFNGHPVITDQQLEVFRKLKSSKVNAGGTMCDNFRPIQKRYGRRIYSNIV